MIPAKAVSIRDGGISGVFLFGVDMDELICFWCKRTIEDEDELVYNAKREPMHNHCKQEEARLWDVPSCCPMIL